MGHEIHLGRVDVGEWMPWVVDEWHKRTGILEMYKGEKKTKQLRDRQREEKKKMCNNSKIHLNMLQHSIPLLTS